MLCEFLNFLGFFKIFKDFCVFFFILNFLEHFREIKRAFRIFEKITINNYIVFYKLCLRVKFSKNHVSAMFCSKNAIQCSKKDNLVCLFDSKL